MHRITTLLAVSTLALALTSAHFFMELTAARERARRDVARECDFEELRAGRKAARPTTISEPAVAAASPGAPSPAAASPIVSRDPLLPPLANVIEMTEEKELLVTRRLYRRIFKALALSEDEILTLLPVLKEQDSRASQPLPKGVESRPQQELERDQAELADVLGAEKAERFTEMRRLRLARAEASRLRRRLDDAGETLSAEQEEALVGVFAPVFAEPMHHSVEDDVPEQSMARLNAWAREREQRLNRAAATVLNATQRQTLEEDEAFRLAMGKRSDSILPPQAGSGASAARAP